MDLPRTIGIAEFTSSQFVTVLTQRQWKMEIGVRNFAPNPAMEFRRFSSRRIPKFFSLSLSVLKFPFVCPTVWREADVCVCVVCVCILGGGGGRGKTAVKERRETTTQAALFGGF